MAILSYVTSRIFRCGRQILPVFLRTKLASLARYENKVITNSNAIKRPATFTISLQAFFTNDIERFGALNEAQCVLRTGYCKLTIVDAERLDKPAVKVYAHNQNPSIATLIGVTGIVQKIGRQHSV